MPRPRPTARRLRAPAAIAAAALGLLGAGVAVGPAARAAASPTLAWVLRGGGALPALVDPAVAYDPDTSSVVLFGGQQPGGSLSAATWVWSGGDWSQVAGPGAAGGPPAREGASMAFDAASHQFILFGGLGAGGQALGDTWAWNGASWVQLTPTGAQPPARLDGALAADAAGHLVLFGGTATGTAATPPTTAAPGGSGTAPPAATGTGGTGTAATLLGDTWTWDGSTWSSVAAPTDPPARTAAAAAWDPVHDQTVLFGGSASTDGTGTPLADTWTWNGAAWSPAAPAASPPPRAGAALAGDPDAGGAVLVGGSAPGAPTSGAAADDWSWDGATWAPLATAGPVPPGRRMAGAAFDTATRSAVVAGGVDASGTPQQATAILALAPPATPPTTIPRTPPTTAAGPTRAAGPSPATTPTTTAAHATGSTPTPPTTAAPAPPTTARGAAPVAAAPPPAPPARPGAGQPLRPGQQLALLGAGFAPRSVVQVWFHSAPERVGTVRAAADGTVTDVVAVPADAPTGLHHFVLVGRAPDGRSTTLSTPVQVVGAAGAGTAARTATLVGLAVGLPLATWLALGWWARRSRAVATA